MKLRKTSLQEGIGLLLLVLLIVLMQRALKIDLAIIILVLLAAGLWVVYRLTARSIRRSEAVINRKQREHTRVVSEHLQAYTTLNIALQPAIPLPILKDWSILPDFARQLVEIIAKHKPKVIVECGCGMSTLLSCYALSRYSGGHIYSLEHMEEYAQQTEELITLHRLSEFSTIYTTPLHKMKIDEREFLWYNPDVLAQIKSIDLLIVDGPPGDTGKLARYPALPVLYGKLSENAIILLDDYWRVDEREMVEEWSIRYHFDKIAEISTERGACMLMRK